MGTAAAVSVEEYLRTSYDPDCDYVDGVIEERNAAKRDHSAVQGALADFSISIARNGACASTRSSACM